VEQISKKKAQVENQYTRIVKPEGNKKAFDLMYSVFEDCDSEWRGLGIIPDSGLAFKEQFVQFDAEKKFPVTIEESRENKNCICGDIMRWFQKAD
jgi:hydrogenase expression/formation protein HypD